MSKNHNRDYGRFLAHSEREARLIREDPDYFKPVLTGARLSKATRERVRVMRHDINRDPLRRGQKVKSLDELINRLLDEHNHSITIESGALIALHTGGKIGQIGKTPIVEGVI